MILACGFAQLYRYRCVSTAIQRQQTRWVVFGMLMSTLFDGANLLPPLIWPALSQPDPAHSLYAILSEVTFPLVLLLVPITIGVAVLRYRLWDIDQLINRTLVYGLLTVGITGLYLLVVVGLGTLFSVLGNLLLSLLATDSLLPIIVQTVAQALKLPSVTLTYQHLGEAVLAASTGEARTSEALVRVPLVAQTEQVGDLWPSARVPGDSLTPADLRLLHDLAPQIAVAVQAMRLTTELKQLTADLQQSRTRLVTAREEERRRLRRDLHDGLGPTLASLTFKIDAARNLLTQESARADRLLEEVRKQTQETLAQIRRLVYDLRPPALDELGLLSALRELAASYQRQGIHILVEVPSNLPALPAAVEVAAYRIAREALTNVVHHAEAEQCLLRLGLHESVLTLQISDDGKGIDDDHRIGVGWLSMRERAVELGGTCSITRGSSGGTTVQASFPLVWQKICLPLPLQARRTRSNPFLIPLQAAKTGQLPGQHRDGCS